MSHTPAISVIAHTRNSAETLPRLLETASWCDERIIVDMSSTDGTADLARAVGWRVVTIEPEPFTDALRNRYLREVAGAWTLVMDSDEHLAADAEGSLRGLVDGLDDDVDGVWIPRFNAIAGRVLRGSGWYPDHQLRLFRSGSIEYLAGHHRPPVLRDSTRRTVRLEPPGCIHIHHENYATLVDFVERQIRYAVTDVYDLDPAAFDFSSYLARAGLEFDGRLQPGADGEHSYALAMLMYWNQIIRGLVHWEKLGYSTSLSREAPLFLPVRANSPVDETEIAALRARLARAERELATMRNSRSVRLTQPLRSAAHRCRRVLRRVRKVLRRVGR